MRWSKYYGGANTNVAFPQWCHDLYRPYDPKETELIKEFFDLADREFANG